jgi:hypothetical protein
VYESKLIVDEDLPIPRWLRKLELGVIVARDDYTNWTQIHRAKINQPLNSRSAKFDTLFGRRVSPLTVKYSNMMWFIDAMNA